MRAVSQGASLLLDAEPLRFRLAVLDGIATVGWRETSRRPECSAWRGDPGLGAGTIAALGTVQLVMRRRLLLVALCVGLVGGCARETRRERVALTKSGACGDAFFWAASADATRAVSVSVNARRRSTTEATTIRFSVPDPKLKVEVLRGHDLDRSMCTDVPASLPTGRQPAKAGHGIMTLDPRRSPTPTDGQSCGVSGTLTIDDVIAPDGTTFDRTYVHSQQIGCYAG